MNSSGRRLGLSDSISWPITPAAVRSSVHWMRGVVTADRPGDDLGERRLADAGYVLDEQVPRSEQAAEGKRRRTVDFDHRIADLFPERMRDVARVDQHSLVQQLSRPLASFLRGNYRRQGGAVKSPARGRAPLLPLRHVGSATLPSSRRPKP